MRKYYYLLFLILFVTCTKDESNQELKACFSIVNTKFSVGDTISFLNCSENALNYQWDFGDGQNSTENEPTHIFTKTGEYEIKLLASKDDLVDSFSTKISVLPLPDKILYKELNPTVQLNTVKSITSYNYGICTEDRPTPRDSITSWGLDIDSDSKNDFKFIVEHSNWATDHPNDYCGHCNIYVYFIKMKALNSGDSISYNPHMDEPKSYNTTEYISTTDAFRNFNILYIQGGCGSVIPRFKFQDSYIGIKHGNKLGWIHIVPFGINGIEIKEFAINDTENNAIKAGRKN